MHIIDWIILITPLLICTLIALYTRRYVRSVADFMAGGRNAGRYLLCTASSEQGAGAALFVAQFQAFFVSGFTLVWWNQLYWLVILMVSISGFVVYRYRQTRAMTLAQFLEMRYSRNFRLFMGCLALIAGLVNFGIVPIIGARFMVYLLGLPAHTEIFSFLVPTHIILMTIFLSTSAITVTMGGQITVLITDCAEGMFSQVFYIIIAIVLLFFFFDWPITKTVLLDTAPGKSLVNPFDSFALKDFNIWLVLMNIFITSYVIMAWQNKHAFNASSSTPHESRMGIILGRWRAFASILMITLLSVCAVTYLKTGDGAAAVEQALSKLPDESTVRIMRAPIILSHFLPVGIKGMLLAILLMGIVAGDGIHLHSWGSIFVQDVVMPLRKKPLSTRQHLRLLRFAVVGVAIFAFIFGSVFPLTDYVQLWWSVTQAIFTAGAGAAVIGGLYWKRGTTQAAWAAVLVGTGLVASGMGTRLYFQEVLHREFALNGVHISFLASIIAIITYVTVSLFTCRKPHNMDQLLHRGQYAVEPEEVASEVKARLNKVPLLHRLMGLDAHFTRMDRWVVGGIFGWNFLFFVIFLLGCALYPIFPLSNALWADYWFIVAICLPLPIAIATTIWFTYGCWRDMVMFFKRLREECINPEDDGSVKCEREAKGEIEEKDEMEEAKEEEEAEPVAGPSLTIKT